MKSKLLLLSVIFSLVILPMISFAETNASTTNKARDTIKNEIEAKKEQIKNAVEERRQNAEDKIKERTDQFVQNVKNRYEAAISRLVILADRIDSRIAKMEVEKKVDTSKAKELMVTAREKIEIAKISITDIASTTITTTNTSASTTKEILKEKFNIIKTQIEKAKEDVKVAHAALVKVVENLKPGQNKLEKENKIEN